MKKDTRKFHYEEKWVNVDEHQTNMAIFFLVIGGAMLLPVFAMATGNYYPDNNIIAVSTIVICVTNFANGLIRLDKGMKYKKVRVYHTPERTVDPSKENVSDKDALNDILGE